MHRRVKILHYRNDALHLVSMASVFCRFDACCITSVQTSFRFCMLFRIVMNGSTVHKNTPSNVLPPLPSYVSRRIAVCECSPFAYSCMCVTFLANVDGEPI